MSVSVRGPAVVNQNCLHLLDVSATRGATELWLMHHCQWASAHCTITETFKVVPQICEFLDQLLTTLSRQETVEAVNQALPRVWEVLSRLASNVALLVHKSACEKLLKCIDIFVSDMPEAASEVKRKAHSWATRLLHGIAKVLDQVNDLSAWDIGSGQVHYDMTDLIRDARIWVDREQSYFVSADEAPRDLTHLLDTCLLFLCLRKPSAIITHVLACIGKLPSTNSAEVAAFLDQANRLLSHSSGYESDFWSTVRAALWECHTVAFESAVVDYATGCTTRQQCLSSATIHLSEDRLSEQNLIETCARSFVLCYRATMMLRQLRFVADGSHCAAIPLCHFHLFLKNYIYKLGSKASFDVGCLYAGYLTEAASITATPVTAYRSIHVLKARMSALAGAVFRTASAAATHSAAFREFSDEINSLMIEQHDWYWAAAIMSASAATTIAEVDEYLGIVVVTHLSSSTECTNLSEFMSDLQKQKAEICSVLENASHWACAETDKHLARTIHRKDSSRDNERLPVVRRVAALDVISVLRHILVGSPEDLILFLCKFSSAPAMKLGIILHVLQMIDVEYWKAVGILTCTAMHCIKTAFERCAEALVYNQPGSANERSANAPCLQAAIDLQRRYADTFPNYPDEKAVLSETTSFSTASLGDHIC